MLPVYKEEKKMKNANTDNMSKRYIGITMEVEGEEPKNYVITSMRGTSQKTGLPQLEGHIWAPSDKSRTGYVQVNRWIWGFDPEKGRLIHDEATGQFRAWVADEWFEGMGISIANIVYSALHDGNGLIDCPFKKPAAKQAVIKTADVMESAPAPEDVDAPVVEDDMQEDLAILDGMDESPLTRLNNGDPTFFMELGATEKQAKRWSKWIRENNTSFDNIADVSKVQGIGKKTTEALTASYNEKYSA